jgi:hypothetical protein
VAAAVAATRSRAEITFTISGLPVQSPTNPPPSMGRETSATRKPGVSATRMRQRRYPAGLRANRNFPNPTGCTSSSRNATPADDEPRSRKRIRRDVSSWRVGKETKNVPPPRSSATVSSRSSSALRSSFGSMITRVPSREGRPARASSTVAGERSSCGRSIPRDFSVSSTARNAASNRGSVGAVTGRGRASIAEVAERVIETCLS